MIEHKAQEYPQNVKDAIEENMQYYNQMVPFIYNPDATPAITKTEWALFEI